MAVEAEKGWVRDQYKYSWLERAAMVLLGVGKLPRHVAFIMDGNRRFAKSQGIATIEGHRGGFNKLAEALQWCRRLGIYEVTVYAFSIENFRRSEEEVNALLQLAKEKFQVLLSEEEKLREHGVRVRVIGDMSLLPEDVREVIAKAEEVTMNNNTCTLTVAFAYTAREEITQAIKKTASVVKSGDLKSSEITEQSLESFMYTSQSSPLDLLIRTSGETRLSDFLLWQASNTVIHFTSVLWPDFTLWHLLAGVFYYQRHYTLMTNLVQDVDKKEPVEVLELDQCVARLLGKFSDQKTE